MFDGLEERFETIHAELGALRDLVDQISDPYFEEIERRATWPEDQSKWSPEDARAYCEAKRYVERETAAGREYERAIDACEACWRKLDPVCDEIRARIATTPAEHHFQLRVMATQHGEDLAELWG